MLKYDLLAGLMKFPHTFLFIAVVKVFCADKEHDVVHATALHPCSKSTASSVNC